MPRFDEKTFVFFSFFFIPYSVTLCLVPSLLARRGTLLLLVARFEVWHRDSFIRFCFANPSLSLSIFFLTISFQLVRLTVSSFKSRP
jgi:hypothetical protein